jgi:5-methylcytosine-specific restriction protein A
LRRPPLLRARAVPSPRTSTTRHGVLYRKAAWTRASKAFRQRPENVLCVDCKSRGLVAESRVTDHKIPHRGDERLFWDEANWQGLCWSCHSSKSRSDASGKPRRPRKGCGVDGMPLPGSGHWWLDEK